jgi:hypothetical protein
LTGAIVRVKRVRPDALSGLAEMTIVLLAAVAVDAMLPRHRRETMPRR